MLTLVLVFFDKLLGNLFSDIINEKIKNSLDRRNVSRTISQCSEAPAQALESYFRNESIKKEKVTIILEEINQLISLTKVDAKILASASLDAEKLTEMILSKNPISQRIKEEGLEWPFKMALQISSDSLCSIGTRFHNWESEAWRRNFEEFDKLKQNLEKILESVGPGGEGSLDDRFTHTYRSHILRRLARIDASTFGISSSLFLDLTTVFVQPNIMKVHKLKKDNKSGNKHVKKVASLEEARREVFSLEEDEDKVSKIKAEKFVNRHKRCAIVGLPGTGKTTLLQHILLATVRDEISFNHTNNLIPVLVRARQLDPSNLPGPDDLLKVVEGVVFANARPGFMKRQFENGKVLLLIDGLDEVVANKQDDFIRWIADYVELYPNSRYIISSRPADYQSDVFQEFDFKEVILCEFDTIQIREYVSRWTKAVEMAEGATPEEAEKTSTDYAAMLVKNTENNPYVRRIARNPLLLSTLCLVQRYEGGDLPNRRVVLYQRCIEGLLFHWDHKRGVSNTILSSLSLERKMMLLRRLALKMQIKGVAEFEESEVEKSFSESLKGIGERIKPQSILNNIRDRSGLLVERKPHIYGFSHLTFQEYLAALSINHVDTKIYDRLFLFSKRTNPQWSEVISLYAGIAPRDSVESLLEELINTRSHKLILLCGECLSATQSVCLEIQKKVIVKLINLPDISRLNLPDTSHLKYEPFRVQRILESYDERIVMEELVPLRNLKMIHSSRYLFFKKDPKSIKHILEAAERIMIGKQKPARWDFGLSLLLLVMENSEATKGLAELANMLLKTDSLKSGKRILWGLWSRDLWRIFEKEGQKLPGALKFLVGTSAIEEQINLCKFISVATPKVTEFKKSGEIKKLVKTVNLPTTTLMIFDKPPKLFFNTIKNLAKKGDKSVRKYAVDASAKLSKIRNISNKNSAYL